MAVPFLEAVWERGLHAAGEYIGVSDQLIKTGNPNGEGLAEWTPYNKSKKFMVFDENPTRMGKPERLRLLKNTLHPNGLGM